MGIVYLARDPLLERDVALKLIGEDSLTPELRYRFLREARVVAKLDHPGIVSVYDIGEHGDALFFVMPVVQGTDLRQRLEQAPLRLRELVELGVQASEALAYSHAQGVIHRDIKPENILLLQDSGEGLRIRIADFGLAVAASEHRLTRSGAVIGTVGYLSPEQVAGKAVDARADLYALGTVLYECVAGIPPFEGDVQALLYRIAHEIPRPLRSVAGDVDEELELAIMACLEKDPARRPQQARELASTLTRYRGKIATTERAESLLATTVKPMRPPMRAPFVGRHAEFAALQQRLNAAVTGESQLVLVAGETGIGKTRLLDELESLAHARSLRVLRGHFAELDEALPYQGFCEIFESFLRRAPSRSSAPLPDPGALEPELAALFPALADLLSVREPTPLRASEPSGARAALSPARRDGDRGSLFELLAKGLARIGGGAPLVLLLENLHAANVSVEALQYVARRLGPTPTLLVGTFTPTEIDRAHPLTKLIEAFEGNKRFELLTLSRLTFAEHCELVAELTAGMHLDGALTRRLYEAAEGNPYFTRELLRSLTDSGTGSRDESGSLVVSSDKLESPEALPETMQKAVERRVERLSDRLRSVLSLASVLGRSFEEAELESIASDDGDLDDALEKLVRGGFLEEQRVGRGDRLAFTSRTVRDVLYAGIPRRKRRSLHRKIAEALEERYRGRLERAYPQLVHHYAQADDTAKVTEFGLKLARTALAGYAAEDAVRAAKAVLGSLDDEKAPEAAEARTLLAAAYRMRGDPGLALKEIELAVTARDAPGGGGARVADLVAAAEIAWEARRTAEAKRWIDRGLRAARAAGDQESLRRLLRLATTAANLRGDTNLARELAEEAERIEGPNSEGHGGTLCVPVPDEMESFDPAFVWTVEQVDVLNTCFETLTREVQGARIVPWLAESFEAEEGGRRFRFRLRQGVRFHDGRPFTAADVRYSFERLLKHPNSPDRVALLNIVGARALVAGQVSELSGLRIVSPHELTIDLETPLSFFPAFLSNAPTAIVPEGATRFDRSWRDGTVGTGPFRLLRMDKNRSAELQANPDYWRAGYPRAEGILFLFVEAPVSSLARFRAGQSSVATNLASADVDSLRHDPAFGPRYREAPSLSTYFILFNGRRGPFADRARRQAVASAIDVDSAVRALGRNVLRARGLLPPGFVGPDLVDTPNASGTRARTADVDALCLVHPAYEWQYAPLLQVLLAEFRRVGVRLTVRTGMFLDHRTEAIDLYFGRWSGNYPDPDAFMYGALHSDGGAYAEFTSYGVLDAVALRARSEVDPSVRRALYVDLERMIREEAVLVPLFYDRRTCFAGARVRGIDDALGTTTRLIDYAALWVEE
jgi:ABC-type transport system substrate-binding protein